MKLFSKLSRATRTFLLFLVLGICILCYEYLEGSLPITGIIPLIEKLIPGILLNGDGQQYIQRFIFSFIFLGLLPLITALLLGFNTKDWGWQTSLSHKKQFPWFVYCIIATLPLFAYFSASQMVLTYPYGKDFGLLIASTVKENILLGLFYWLIHAFMYAILYYLPWETLRALLSLPLLRILGSPQKNSSQNYILVSFQTFPTAMLHFGHPFSEILGSFAFGLLAAWLLLYTGRIWLILGVHIASGLILDSTLIFLL